jgi:hypothetical protein
VKRLTIAILVLSIAGQMAFTHVWSIYLSWDETPAHRAIIDGTAEPPFRYRVLLPHMADWLSRDLNAGAVERVIIAHDMLATLAIVGFVIALYRFLRRFYAPSLCIGGLALVSSMSAVIVVRPHMIGYSWFEALLFTLALTWLYDQVWGGSDGKIGVSTNGDTYGSLRQH